jgi:palmitoyltransferase ZDHHC4
MAIPEMMFLPKVLPTLGLIMNVLVTVVVLGPYAFLYLSAAVDPGYVLKKNLDIHGSLYPYDYNLFVPGHMCKTCRQAKPARSKHCSVCGYCVSKADHHCIFINGCVGYGNHHWFLLLLFTTAVLTSMGAWLGGTYTLNLIASTFPPFTFRGHGLSWSEYFFFWGWAMAEQPRVGSIALLCFLTAPLIWGLYLYSMYLAYRGMTTNESGKWGDFQLDVSDGYIFRRPLSNNRQPDRRMEPEVPDWPKDNKYYYARAYHEPLESTADLPGEGQWEKGGQEWTLADVDNIYDIGLVGNMIDVFLPRKYLAAYNGNGGNFPD